jgi:hypothetical protein
MPNCQIKSKLLQPPNNVILNGINIENFLSIFSHNAFNVGFREEFFQRFLPNRISINDLYKK